MILCAPAYFKMISELCKQTEIERKETDDKPQVTVLTD